jgi:uncharacterized membrane protein YfcA
MDYSLIQLSVFLLGTFLAALVAGVVGFAFALIAAAVWLQVLPPVLAVPVILAYAIIVQTYGVWKLRHAFSWNRLWPFLLGGVPGIGMGLVILRTLHPPASSVRTIMGIVLIAYAAYGLWTNRPKMICDNRRADFLVGLTSGMIGPLTGFPGLLITIWSGHRGWAPDIQRGVFQPANVFMVLACTIGLGLTGSITVQSYHLFLLGLAPLLLGTWAGFQLYAKVDQRLFRKLILALLFISGVPLLVA